MNTSPKKQAAVLLNYKNTATILPMCKSIPHIYFTHLSSWIFSDATRVLVKSIEIFYGSMYRQFRLYSIASTAEFNKTMTAEEYRQSLSSNFVYTSEDSATDEEDE